MGIYDSPIYRGSQDLTQTLLNIARLNQYKRQLDLEEQERQRKAGLETEDRARATSAREEAEGLFSGLGQMPIKAAPPGPRMGGAPFVSPPQDASALNTTPKTLDIPRLLGAMIRGKGVEMAGDPQFAQMLHASGIMKSPEGVKLGEQATDRASRAPGVAKLLQDRYPNKTMADLLEIASAVPVNEADSWGRMPILQQQADTGSGRLAAALEDMLATRATRIEQQAAGAAANRARAAKTNEETKFVGTSKAGKPAESDKRVSAWVENYLNSEDFGGTPENKGLAPDFGITYGSKPAVSRREAAAADVKAELNPQLHDIKMRAYQEAFGDQQGTPAATAAKSRMSGQKTARPDGTYKLPSGETVTVRGGVIQ